MKQLKGMKALQRGSIAAVAALVLAGCGSAPTTVSTVKVQRGAMQVTVSGNGTVEPTQSSDLTFGVSGKVQKVLAKEGEMVKEGQLLATLDPRELDQQVLQAEANLASARAKLQQAASGNVTDQDKAAAQANIDEVKAEREKIQNGSATEADIVGARAQVRNAEANLQRARTGNVTKADIDNAQAAVRNAEANLQRARTAINPADIANAQAAVRSAEANLQRVRTGNVTKADVDTAQAAVRSAEANLQRAHTGNITQADIDTAQAAVRSAEAKLSAVMLGPPAEQVSTTRAKLTQAQQNYQKIASADSANKSQAAQNVDQVADKIRQAQQAYSTAYWNNQQAQAGIDPQTGRPFAKEPILSRLNNPEARKQAYAAALNNAELALRQAESQLEQAKIAYENAKQQEINDLATAQAQVDDAQVQLDELLKGPKDADVAQAQALVDQARAQLQKLQQGGTPADVAQAQALVDQARAQLQKLQQGGTPADVAQAQAQVDQARAQLQKLLKGVNPADIAAAQALVDQAQAQVAKLRQGVNPADIAAAQALVDQAQAQVAKLQQGGAPADISAAEAKVEEAQAKLDKLSGGGTASDRAIGEAGARQAEAQLAAAQLSRDNAALRAPFTGIITAVNVAPGDRVSATGTSSGNAMFTLVDASQLHVDVSISEADIAQIKPGQKATVKIDALGTQAIDGTVGYIAPAGTTVQNVTTYRARVDLPRNNNAIRVAMSATVNVGVAGKHDVLVIPSRAVRTTGEKRFVRLQQGKTFVDREIRIGLVNDLQTEVISGLAEGDIIALRSAAPTNTNGAQAQ